MANTIYWHDYETFGADPRCDRASQFAGVRTDEDLNLIGEPLRLYCQPAPDMLPHPMACLITGITPQQAQAQGVSEAEFIARIHREFVQPQTCVSGYNSLRFDDEMTRQLLYRNFYDPYEREWKNGNSRWDIIDMVRLCCALRPEGIEWPLREDGSPSFRLEELTKANGIAHEDAHDALSDVLATIAMARLIKERQPRLYSYVYELRDKNRVQAQLDIVGRKPVLHVSSMYPAALGCLALAVPLTRHPRDKNGVLMLDLRDDPASWLHLPVEEMRRRLFSAADDLVEGESRIPVKVLHVNRCPVVAPSTLLSEDLARKYRIDLPQARRHWQTLMENPEAISRLASVYDETPGDGQLAQNPDFMLYTGGFFGAQDKQAMAQIRQATAAQLGVWQQPFVDERLDEMLFRYRARNFPQSLRPEERLRWQAFCHANLHRDPQERGAGVSSEEYFAEIARLRESHPAAREKALLDSLESYGRQLAGE